MDTQRIVSQIDLSHYMIDEEAINLVVPGDMITHEEGFMKYLDIYPAAMVPIG